MATTGIMTISAVNGRYNHRFIGDIAEPGIQLPALGDWLAWCRKLKHAVDVDSFLSYVHQMESPLLHRLTGIGPAFGDRNVVREMEEHYEPFLSQGSVRNVYHVNCAEGRFGSVTALRRGGRSKSAYSWVVSQMDSLDSVWWHAADAAKKSARETRRVGHTVWEVDPEGTALDFLDAAKRQLGYAEGLVKV